MKMKANDLGCRSEFEVSHYTIPKNSGSTVLKSLNLKRVVIKSLCNFKLDLQGMFNKFSKLLLFLLAYLVVIMVMLYSYLSILTSLYVAILVPIAVGAGVILLNVGIFRLSSDFSVPQVSVQILENKNSDYLLFVVTFILPLVFVEPSVFHFVILIVILSMVYFTYTDTNVFAVNPMLKIVLRYNIFKVKFNNKTHYILTKEEYDNEEVYLNIVTLSKDVYLDLTKME